MHWSSASTVLANADAKNFWGESAASSEVDKTSNEQSHSTTKSSTGHKTYASTFNVDGTETEPVVDNTTTETTSTSSGSIVKSSTEWNGASNYAGELGYFYLGASPASYDTLHWTSSRNDDTETSTGKTVTTHTNSGTNTNTSYFQRERFLEH